MLFNSPEFLLLFLPLTLAGYLALRSWRRIEGMLGLLLVASLIFYAAWNPRYLILLMASMAFNFAIGQLMQARRERNGATGSLLLFGVTANLLALGWFKYANFTADNLNRLLDIGWELEPITLPLAISFFTFQQIAYLADQHRGTLSGHGLRDYMLFVCYFPQLIAGPIVHFRELQPQFGATLLRRPLSPRVAIGLTALAIGLAKKVLIADKLSQAATPLFQSADLGLELSCVEAWMGSLAYAFQIYFDFSGYSDMAIGLSMLFGIDLPVNFLSPYRAQSITEFWRRWHVTLSTFLRDYVYIPLGGNRRGTARQRLNLLITMLLGGIWHGAGWNFLLWGALHAAFLVIHQSVRDSAWISRARSLWAWPLAAWCATFLAVICAWVPFRAETTIGTLEILRSMAFIEGADLPATWAAKMRAAGIPAWLAFGSADVHIPFRPVSLALMLLGSLVLVTAFPCTAQICGVVESVQTGPLRLRALGWQAVAVAVLFAIALLAIGSPSEFLYFNF